MSDTMPSSFDKSPRFWRRGDVLVALVGFAIFIAVVLTKAAALLEPDDYAYRASIVALSHGHILLTNAQYLALSHQLSANGGQGILQWHHLTSGKWISEKNPGYPFFAVLFYWLHALRVAPLFYGALACTGLFVGARAWLGKWAGTYAVWLYCFSGAALTFAWRDTMPSFSDASLIGAGAGLLLWTMLSQHASTRKRLWIGLAGFVAIEGAVFIRYTNVLELGVAIVAVLVLAKRCAISWRSVFVWMTSVVLFGAGVLAFDQWAYGKATSTGYSPGEISFSFSSLWPNLKLMPKQLTTSMPVWILSALALAWIVTRFVRRLRVSSDDAQSNTSRDLIVAVVLAAGWLGLWFLYLTYTWTAQMGAGPGGGSGTVHVIRFYLPALGLIALLATWLLVHLHRILSWFVLLGLVIFSLLSFHSMASSGAIGAGGVGGPGGFFGNPFNSPSGQGVSGHYYGPRPPKGSRPGQGPPPSLTPG
jgi:hypothetical protein